MITFDQLSPKKRILLTQALEVFDRGWDEEASLLSYDEDENPRHGTRGSVYYALSLLIRNQPGDAARADRILHAVLDLQLCSPGEIWQLLFHYQDNGL